MSANERNPDSVSVFSQTTKRYGNTSALDALTLEIPRGAIVGLVGRNGCGKTTLLHHITGMVLPTSGQCTTFGVPTAKLSARELSRIGVVHQHAKHLGWMKTSRLIRYVSSFYESWDRAYEAELVKRLELGKDVTVSTLSPGNVQKLSLLLALCYRPEVLLLDEPLSDLDPTARKEVLALLLEYFSSPEVTMIVSSHLLHDIEPLVTRIVCMDRGRVTANEELDVLKEEYEEWTVTLNQDTPPPRWDDLHVVQQQSVGRDHRLVVRGARGRATEYALRWNANIATRALNLESLFPILSNATSAVHENVHAVR